MRLKLRHPFRFNGEKDFFIEDWSDEEDDDAERTIEQAEEGDQQAGDGDESQEPAEA